LLSGVETLRIHSVIFIERCVAPEIDTASLNKQTKLIATGRSTKSLVERYSLSVNHS